MYHTTAKFADSETAFLNNARNRDVNIRTAYQFVGHRWYSHRLFPSKKVLKWRKQTKHFSKIQSENQNGGPFSYRFSVHSFEFASPCVLLRRLPRGIRMDIFIHWSTFDPFHSFDNPINVPFNVKLETISSDVQRKLLQNKMVIFHLQLRSTSNLHRSVVVQRLSHILQHSVIHLFKHKHFQFYPILMMNRVCISDEADHLPITQLVMWHNCIQLDLLYTDFLVSFP